MWYNFAEFFATKQYETFMKDIKNPIKNDQALRRAHLYDSFKAVNGRTLLFHDKTTLLEIGFEEIELR